MVIMTHFNPQRLARERELTVDALHKYTETVRKKIIEYRRVKSVRESQPMANCKPDLPMVADRIRGRQRMVSRPRPAGAI